MICSGKCLAAMIGLKKVQKLAKDASPALSVNSFDSCTIADRVARIATQHCIAELIEPDDYVPNISHNVIAAAWVNMVVI